jgi:hypothetical protein
MSRAPSSTARPPGGPPRPLGAGSADVALVRHRDERAVDPAAMAALGLAAAP